MTPIEHLVFGVATYNRSDVLAEMSASLRRSRIPGELEVSTVVVDDASTEYGLADLERHFPGSAMSRNRKNLGANGTMQVLFEKFLETDGTALAITDNDLLFHPDWISTLLEVWGESDGAVRLYNSAQNPTTPHPAIAGHRMLRADFLASAGFVVSRKHIEHVVASTPVTSVYDWAWSRELAEAGHRLLVTERSWIQHIGMQGYNSDGVGFVDFGLNFLSGSVENERVVTAMVDSLLTRDHEMIQRRLDEVRVTGEAAAERHLAAEQIGRAVLRVAGPLVRLSRRSPVLHRLVVRLRHRLATER